MTALSAWERLEAVGAWIAGPGAPPREVVLSLGDATLVISGLDSVALAHWSLAAVERANPGRMPAVYAPSADAAERVETGDADMVAAIERVRRAVARRARRGSGLRWLVPGAVALLVAAAAAWGHAALPRLAAEVLPPSARAGLDADLLARIEAGGASVCRLAEGRSALRALMAALGRTDTGADAASLPPAARVMDGLAADAAILPGGTALLSRRLVEAAASEAAVAARLGAAAGRFPADDPLAAALAEAGALATLRFLATGEIGPELRARWAEAARAGLPPFDLPAPGAEGARLLADADWVALQGICG